MGFMRFGKRGTSNVNGDEGARALNNQHHRRQQPGKEALNHARNRQPQMAIARVTRQVNQTILGRVIWEAVSYPAYCLSANAFEPGTFVQVLDRRNNTLIVGALPLAAPCPKSAITRTQITA